MTDDDVLFGYRLRLFTSPTSSATSPRPAGRWGSRARLLRLEAEARALRARRAAGEGASAAADAEPDRTHLEHRIIAFALGHPGFGARRIAAELARPKWGAIGISEHGVWRVLKRFNLNTRSKRLALIARHADPYERRPEQPPKELHIDASEPGEKLQMDCFFVGRLAGPQGLIWQYTATDVASAYSWAFLRSTHLNPSARFTAELVHLVARELKAAGWKLGQVTTDNGSEFRAGQFADAVGGEGATQRRIKAGRPDSNGCVEQTQLTILEECWRPAFSRSLAPKITALQRDLAEYLDYYNNDRAHTGRLTNGRLPADIVLGARKMATVR